MNSHLHPHRRDTSHSLDGSDPSTKIWGLYLSQAERIDKEHSESWTANTEGVLVFVRHESCREFVLFSRRGADQTGLFSAVVATFLVVSYPLLQPNSTDTTNRLLGQISQQLSSNGTSPSQSQSSAPFKPTASAVRVNTLWFTSLAFSTACALWATLMQQWTRRYLQVADRPYAPPRRARIRAFFSDGVEKFALAAAVEVLPALLHASVLLFYVGLIDFLINVHHTVAFILLAWVVIGCLTYFVLTIMPLFFPNSPYQTPLSSLCWFVMEATPLLRLWLRKRTDNVRTDIRHRRARIGHGMRRALESKADKSKVLHEADTNALRWTLRSLEEDHEFEEFLDGLPGLFHGSARHYSVGLREGLEHLVKPVADKLLASCATGLLPEGLRRQRLTACLRAVWCFSGAIDRHFRAIWEQWDKVTNDPIGPLSTETWAVAANMTTELDPFMAVRAHCIQALMAAMWRRGRWQCDEAEAAALLQRQLGASSVDVERWSNADGPSDQLQLAVAANLLSQSLPLLHKLEKHGSSADTSLKIELKAILDTICRELDASDVPHELRARFVAGAEVMKVFNIQEVSGRSHRHGTFDLNGPWTKIFTPVDIN